MDPLANAAEHVALSTDLYELTMAARYAALDLRGDAVFDLFVRELPERRAFLVTAGLEDALRRATRFALGHDEVQYLVDNGHVRASDAPALERVRFTGDVWAVPEGRVVFADEPLVEVRAPMLEAQLVETLLLNALHFPTLVATKAARCVHAARGRALVDFGLRRAPGVEAGLAVARAAWLAGFAATSDVLAARALGIPASGTVAHSFVEAFAREADAFRAWAASSPGPFTLLVDTYESLGGVAHAIDVARTLPHGSARFAAVRLDSGDLAALSRRARAMLDDAGMTRVRIVASGALDEYAIDALVQGGAPIDAFGVGTRLATSADAPVLDVAYKLVEYAGAPALKLSEGKESVVGAKQVWRRRDAGRFVEDRVCARDEPRPAPDWEPLLAPVVTRGALLDAPTLAASRARHAEEVRAFPPELFAPEPRARYPVARSEVLVARQRAAVDAARRREGFA